MKELDERGWVFVAKDCAFRCCMWGERAWLFRWNDSEKHWVSLMPLTQSEIWQLPHNLTDEQQEYYFKAEAETVATLMPTPPPADAGEGA